MADKDKRPNESSSDTTKKSEDRKIYEEQEKPKPIDVSDTFQRPKGTDKK